MKKHPALVGIVPRKNLWDIIQKERWCHIPVESAPRNAGLVSFVLFALVGDKVLRLQKRVAQLEAELSEDAGHD